MAIMYILSGLALVIVFTFVIVYYFSPKRKDHVEAAKYDMLNDSDVPTDNDESEADSEKE